MKLDHARRQLQLREYLEPDSLSRLKLISGSFDLHEFIFARAVHDQQIGKSRQRLQRGTRIGVGADEYALGWMVIRREWAKGARPGDSGRSLHHAGSNNSWFALVWIAVSLKGRFDL